MQGPLYLALSLRVHRPKAPVNNMSVTCKLRQAQNVRQGILDKQRGLSESEATRKVRRTSAFQAGDRKFCWNWVHSRTIMLSLRV